jgi:hypothetical protein
MRSIFAFLAAAASLLLANVASAECNQIVRRPLVTVAQSPVGSPVLTVEVGGN